MELSPTVNSLIHIFFNGAFIAYIGTFKPSNKIFYYILGTISILILLKLLYRIYSKKMRAWHWVHLILFVPLFMYVSYYHIIDNKDKLKYYHYSFLTAIGLAAMTYHKVSF